MLFALPILIFLYLMEVSTLPCYCINQSDELQFYVE